MKAIGSALGVYIMYITQTDRHTHTHTTHTDRDTRTLPDHEGDRIGVPLGVSGATYEGVLLVFP
jgi:hypothetical protein